MELQRPSLREHETKFSSEELINRVQQRIPPMGFQFLSINEYVLSCYELNEVFSQSVNSNSLKFRRLLKKSAEMYIHLQDTFNAIFIFDALKILKYGLEDVATVQKWLEEDYVVPKSETHYAIRKGYPELDGISILKEFSTLYD